jgi:hypothetical protein
MIFLKPAVVLVGGPSNAAGNVFARNPATGIYGPVCDDNWDILDVIIIFINIPLFSLNISIDCHNTIEKSFLLTGKSHFQVAKNQLDYFL